jgi:hypothetical protein
MIACFHEDAEGTLWFNEIGRTEERSTKEEDLG